MDDFNCWWYIIAAVIYFLTRGKKKKQPAQTSRPGTENKPTSNRPKSFEELLREITEGDSVQDVEERVDTLEELEEEPKPERELAKNTGKRAFADDESKRVYEESIKMAEGADLDFAPEEQFQSDRLFKDTRDTKPTERSFAEKLMNDFDMDEAKKAVIYSEILNRKY